ncbi:MAG TPA: tyrosine-type recombinase/integrase [Terriglobia bacterium]|nr:tyrosine-type recombinase/integrase [Terriglobia bacterium]
MASIENHRNLFRVIWRDRGEKQFRSFETREQAEKFKEEIERHTYRRSISERIDRSQEKLSDICQTYINALNIAPITRTSYQRSIFLPFITHFEGRTITSLTSLDVQAYIGDRRTKVMASTLGKEYSILKKFFRWATTHFLLPVNPVELIRVRRIRKSPGVCLSYEQMKKVFDSVTPYQRTKLLLARDAGLRAKNIGLLKRSSIDFERNTLTFNVLKKGEDDPRDSETRTIPMTRRLSGALSQFQDGDPSALLFTFKAKSLQDPDKFLKRLRPKVGFHFRWHDLRHTFYTRMLEATDNYALAEWCLGHSITYWHPTPEKLQEAFRLMERKAEQGIAKINRDKFKVVGD